MDKTNLDIDVRFPAWECPPAEFCPAVLWSWNGDMTTSRILETLAGLAARQVGGVFIHARPGLITEYLSREWFELWACALAECNRLGIGCHIYDENSFPSGFGGGYVMAANPLAGTSRLTGRWVDKTLDSPNGQRMGFLDELPSGTIVSPDALVLALDLEKFPASLWQAGFPMVDVCRPEVTDQFLESTHAMYARWFAADFGKTIRYAFTDEPETCTSDKGFYMSMSFLREFRAQHGYALESRLGDLCGATAESFGVRHDYFVTLNRLFTENFSKKCYDWCEEHCLQFTGHFLENQWPFPAGSPSTMAAQRWMQTPGIDLLGFQFQPGTLRDNALWLLIVKEATSIAAQCAHKEVLCESCGGGGYDYAPAQMKPLEDFLLALGVNRIVPHLAHESLAGVRKYDWPQTISDHSPWWDAFGTHAQHVARVNYLLSQGVSTSRTLVIHPTTTGWLHYRPACFHRQGETPHAPLHALRASYSVFLADLYSGGVDFDLGDESVMAEMGEMIPPSEAGAEPLLRIGARFYQTVVVPIGLENMLSSTVQMLEHFLNAGGTVLCAGSAPTFVDGRRIDFPLTSLSGWTQVEEGLIAQLLKRHPARLATSDGTPLPTDMLWRYSELSKGDVVIFFSNPTASSISTTLALPDCIAFDTLTGEKSSVIANDGGIELFLPPHGHALWWCPSQPVERISSSHTWAAMPVEFLGCEPQEANLLPLDYCRYEAPQTPAAEMNTMCADTLNWKMQGFDQNLWRVSIQFRKSFLDAPIPDGTGFVLQFAFQTTEDFANSAAAQEIQLAVERPWLYEISCNGQPISQEFATPWFDEEMRLLPLAGFVQEGVNSITVCARKFHVLAEIAPVILRGCFRALPSESGFLLAPMESWKTGEDWRAEGYAFYPRTVCYQYQIQTRLSGFIRVTLPEFQGSAVGIQLDEPSVLWRFESGQRVEFSVSAGEHRMQIFLCGNLKNLMGPHFNEGLPGAWSWENCPSTQPPACAYRFYQTGLSGLPTIDFSQI